MKENNKTQNEQLTPDYVLTGEEWYLREGSHSMELLAALGNIAMHLTFLTDAIYDMTQKQEATNIALGEIKGMLQAEDGASIGAVAASATRKLKKLSGISHKMAGIVVNMVGMQNSLEGIDKSHSEVASAMFDSDGDGVGESLSVLTAEVGCACDPGVKDSVLKVEVVDGQIHPYE